MATLWQRITGQAPIEKRLAPPPIPARSNSTVSTTNALSLTAVYRCIQIIATPIAKALPLETYRYAGGIEQKIPNPLLVTNPSLSETRRDFIFSTVSSLALEGNAFWFKTYDARGIVNDLTILPASSVGVRLDGPTGMTGAKVYDYMGKTYSGAEIEHLRLFTTAGNLRGIGPIQAASQDILAAIDLRDFAATWFSNAGVPTGVLQTSKTINKDIADDITTAWHTKQSTRQIAVLADGFTYAPVQLSPKDALLTEYQSQVTQNIARLFGVPARLLLTGVDGTSDTYANLQDEQRTFWLHTLMNFTDVIEDALSRCLPRATRVQFNFEGLFKADQKQRFETYAIATGGAPFMTTDEVRVKENLG
jgi:HK97 family phage portal protein